MNRNRNRFRPTQLFSCPTLFRLQLVFIWAAEKAIYFLIIIFNWIIIIIVLCETNIVKNQAVFCLEDRHLILISSIRLSLESPWILSHEGLKFSKKNEYLFKLQFSHEKNSKRLTSDFWSSWWSSSSWGPTSGWLRSSCST